MDGDAPAVRASLIRLYQGHGFTVDPNAYIPIILTTATYTIRVAMFPRDHAEGPPTSGTASAGWRRSGCVAKPHEVEGLLQLGPKNVSLPYFPSVNTRTHPASVSASS
jgi:hypothetical protein